jgi:hypothetical protein
MCDLSKLHRKRALVCGGRTYDDGMTVGRVLDSLDPSSIIEGGADGADWLARLWSLQCGVASSSDTYAPRPEDARRWGHARARTMRNARMLAEGKPDYVLAFPGGRGTEDMVSKAKAAGVPVLRVRRDGSVEVDEP